MGAAVGRTCSSPVTHAGNRPLRDVRTKVEKFGRVRLEDVPGQSLGDVDVLLIDRASKILWPIECKDLVFAKTPR